MTGRIGLGLGMPLVGKWGGGEAVPDPSIYGWNESYDEGTTGDFFVDGSRSDDTGDGLTLATAKKTIQAALTASSGSHVILVKDHGSPYRELVSFSGEDGTSSGARRVLKGYGTDKPTISGAEVLTGFVACDSGDEAVVGPNYASMYKKTGVSIASIAGGDPRALNLHEAGTPMIEAIDRASDNDEPLVTFNPNTWWTADTVYTTGDVAATGGDVITGYKDTSVTGNYTQAQIENADVLYYYSNNLSGRVPVDSFGSDIVQITTTGQYETSASKDKWALVNILPAMQQGGFGFVDHGDGTCTVYIWPTNPANVAANIEFSARENCIDVASADFVEIASLRLVQAAGTTANSAGSAIKSASGAGNKKEFLTLRNVYAGGHLNTSGLGYGGIYLSNYDDLLIENCTLENLIGMYGWFIQGGTTSATGPSDFAMRGTFRFNRVSRAEKSPFRFYGQRESLTHHCYAEYCGRASHANLINFYEQCYDNLVWGVKFDNCGGYVTWQEADNHFLFFVYAPAGNGTQKRSIVDQNGTTVAPGDYLGNRVPGIIANCTCPPQPSDLSYTDNFKVGVTAQPDIEWEYYNNIFHEDSEVGAAYITGRDYNIDTLGTPAGANSLASSHGAVYVDAANGDFSFKSGGPQETFVGRDMRDKIAAVLYPRFGSRIDDIVDRDANYALVNWADAPAGHKVQRAASADTTAPTISNLSPTDGATEVAVDADFVITFSEPVIAGTGNISLYDASDDSLVEAFDVTTDAVFAGLTVTFTPSSDLDSSASYYVQIDATAVKDISGNTFAGIADETTWNFVTASGLSPFSVTHTGRFGNTSGTASTITFNNVDFGDEPTGGDARTAVVAVGYCRATLALDISGVTVNGNAATLRVKNDAVLMPTGIFEIDLPTGSGATHTVVVTGTQTQTADASRIDTYRVINGTFHDSGQDTDTSGLDLDLSLDIPTDGEAIAAQARADNSASTLSFTGVTADGSPIDMSTTDQFHVGHGGAAGTPHTITASATGTPQAGNGVSASYGPA